MEIKSPNWKKNLFICPLHKPKDNESTNPMHGEIELYYLSGYCDISNNAI